MKERTYKGHVIYFQPAGSGWPPGIKAGWRVFGVKMYPTTIAACKDLINFWEAK